MKNHTWNSWEGLTCSEKKPGLRSEFGFYTIDHGEIRGLCYFRTDFKMYAIQGETCTGEVYLSQSSLVHDDVMLSPDWSSDIHCELVMAWHKYTFT